MATPTESFVLLAPNHASAATITASDETTGQEAINAVTMRHDTGWGADFSATRTLTVDFGTSPPETNWVACLGLFVAGAGLTPELVTGQWESDDDVGFGSPTDWGTKLWAIRASGSPEPRLDMAQPNLGPTDADLIPLMAQGRLHTYFSLSSPVTERYHRLTISHSATSDPSQTLFLPIVTVGWGWQPSINFERGGLTQSQVSRTDGSTLRRFSLNVQAVFDDEWHLKLQETLLSQGDRNRVFFWPNPARDERFLSTAGMYQVTTFEVARNEADTVSANDFDSTGLDPSSLRLTLVERFSDEGER